MRKIWQILAVSALIGCGINTSRNYAPINSVGAGTISVDNKTFTGSWRYYDESFGRTLYLYCPDYCGRVVNAGNVEIINETEPTRPYDGR